MKTLLILLAACGFAMAQNPVLRDYSCTAASAAGTDNYACSALVAPASYAAIAGKTVCFTADVSNTSAATFNLNSLGQVAIKIIAGGVTTDPATNDIRAGEITCLRHDGTNWQLQSPLGNAGSGTSVLADCSDPTVSCVLEPFMNGSNSASAIGALGWAIMSTGGSITSVTGVAGHWGIYQMSAAAAANNVSGIDLSGASGVNPLPALTAESNWTTYHKFRTPASLTEVAIIVGLYVGGVLQVFPVSGIAGSGIYARYYSGTGCNNTAIANGTDATWIYVTKSATSTTTENAGPAIAASTWYWLRIASDGAGGIKFSMKADGGTFPADTTVTTSVPAVAITPVFKIATCEAVAKVLQADEFRIVRTGLN